MLGLAAFTYRPEGPTRAVIWALATRMGVAVDDPAVRIILDTWAVMIAAAVDIPEVATLGPGDVISRIDSAYAVFIRLWRPWRNEERTPPGEPGR